MWIFVAIDSLSQSKGFSIEAVVSTQSTGGVTKKQGYKCSACGGVAHSKCRATSGTCFKSPLPLQTSPAPRVTQHQVVARYANALFDFPPESEHELELKVGDKIEVLQQEGEWWFGSLPDGRKGYFPYNYVEKIGDW
eukprot:TRINITY_DN5373_c0_g1_i2.p1 TRINITY_DN5373_c0_g1~~TRINITY_DN5373_c0_g1_i2.p1  ORF type:complete len:137 (-),score=29.11 TRINITY_DN5373_c0_g1_i2:2-412(-)